MALRLGPSRARFPITTELRCGRCFKKLGNGQIKQFEGVLELLCTRRSKQETCRTMNTYTGSPEGYLEHDFARVPDDGGLG